MIEVYPRLLAYSCQISERCCAVGEEELPPFLQYSDEELQEAIQANQKTRTTSNRPLSTALAAVPQVRQICPCCTPQYLIAFAVATSNLALNCIHSAVGLTIVCGLILPSIATTSLSMLALSARSKSLQ